MIKVKNQHRLAMSQKPPVNNFEWIEDACQFNEKFVKTYNEQMMNDILLKLMFNILKCYLNFIMVYQFYL